MDAAAIADIFATFRPIHCRRMFGGLGLFVDGVMFGLVAADRIYLKTDDDFARELEGRGSEPFVYEKGGRRVTIAYWSLPEAAIDDADAAAELAARATRIACAAALAKPRTSRVSKKIAGGRVSPP